MLTQNAVINRRSLGLVKSISKLGIEVPKQVRAEVRIYEDVEKAHDAAQSDYDAAAAGLRTAEAHEFDTARDGFIQAASDLQTFVQGAGTALIDAAVHRLNSAIYDASPAWESAIVDQFNAVVAQHELNEVAGNLPDLGDPRLINVLSFTRAQGDAVDRWKTASGQLRPLWEAYKRIATHHGHEIGPVSSNNVATNMFTACVLGDPGTRHTLEAATGRLSAMGSVPRPDSVQRYAEISPFIVPVLHGYELNLSSLADAAAIRRRVQGL